MGALWGGVMLAWAAWFIVAGFLLILVLSWDHIEAFFGDVFDDEYDHFSVDREYRERVSRRTLDNIARFERRRR